MVFNRARFGLSVVGDNIYASAGFDFGDQTIEVFSEGEGWREVETMYLDKSRYGHCSVALNDEVLVVMF